MLPGKVVAADRVRGIAVLAGSVGEDGQRNELIFVEMAVMLMRVP